MARIRETHGPLFDPEIGCECGGHHPASWFRANGEVGSLDKVALRRAMSSLGMLGSANMLAEAYDEYARTRSEADARHVEASAP